MNEQMERLRPFFPKSHGKPRVDGRTDQPPSSLSDWRAQSAGVKTQTRSSASPCRLPNFRHSFIVALPVRVLRNGAA
ncbi:hypothetical protein F1C10_11400 [Sphingomonas sp. NBWT7]|nr:hypothetical protein F1C10_11400 [Sphingomonas sp. NBWT7]